MQGEIVIPPSLSISISSRLRNAPYVTSHGVTSRAEKTTHITRVETEPLRVSKRGLDPLELPLNVVAADQVAEQIILELGAIGRSDAVFRVEVLGEELGV